MPRVDGDKKLDALRLWIRTSSLQRILGLTYSLLTASLHRRSWLSLTDITVWCQ